MRHQLGLRLLTQLVLPAVAMCQPRIHLNQTISEASLTASGTPSFRTLAAKLGPKAEVANLPNIGGYFVGVTNNDTRPITSLAVVFNVDDGTTVVRRITIRDGLNLAPGDSVITAPP